MDEFFVKFVPGNWLIAEKKYGYDRTKKENLTYVAESVSFDEVNIYSREEIFQDNTPVWVQKTLKKEEIDLKEYKVIEDKEIHPLAHIIKQGPPVLDYYRISGDYTAEYGDGGYSRLAYPVYIAPNLKGVNEKARKTISKLLRKINGQKKDFHTNSPVQDIIDPDLFPCLDLEADYVLNRVKEFNLRINKGESKRDLREEFPADLLEGYCQVDEGLKIREKYHWVPTHFRVNYDHKVEILSPINGIPNREEHDILYQLIAHVFSKMIPMFSELGVVNWENGDTKPKDLQVIVKAQQYELTPGMTYAGRWHKEGQTENIIAAGVYYSDVGETHGGNLKFRPKEAPQPWYNIETDHSVPVQNGTAVVFSNSIPHRFRKISNHTDSNQKRTFINFFVVDPAQKLSYPTAFCTKSYLSLCLRRAALDTLGVGRMPPTIVKEILKYLTKLWVDEDEAKEFRSKSREAMLKNVSGWGYINWGNCGTSQFVLSKSVLSNRYNEEMGKLHHTESE